MANVLESKYVAEAGHWYDRVGNPCYTRLAKNGNVRNTTLADARKELLVPSVTTIINEANKPALVQWMQKQVLLAALTLPRLPGELDDDYCARIMEDSKEQGKLAAQEGTKIHAAIERWYETGEMDFSYSKHIIGTEKAIQEKFGDVFGQKSAEKSFSHHYGFGGKVDLSVSNLVLDVKGKDFDELPTKENKIKLWWDEHCTQLAAYRVGLGMPTATCANVFVSRTSPGLVYIHVWEEEELCRGWNMFSALLRYWQAKTGFESGWEK